ncbi:MAG: PLP-dependent aminotransferase family protein [Candidatus Promineifilaceae bacterium]
MTDLPSNQIELMPGVIDLGIGQPDFQLLPLAEMRRVATARLAEADTTLLNYGYGMGDGRFRTELAAFLTRHYHIPVLPETLFATAGASQGLDLLCTLLTQPGDTIFVEEPSYFLALKIFADHGLHVVGIPTDSEGLIPDAVTEALRHHHPVFLYTIPAFQNPSGTTMTAARRQMLLSLAEAHDFLVVADEVYHLLAYTAVLPLPLAAFWESRRVISIGSFSKIFAPGLRLGWLQAAPALLQPIAECGLVDSGGGLNHFTSALVARLLADGEQDVVLARLQQVYGKRVQVMAQAFDYHLAGYGTFVVPDGGFFFWVRLNDRVDTAVLQQLAPSFGVNFHPGSKFSSSQGCQNAMRLSFAFYGEADLVEGVARLGRLLTANLG